MLNLLQLVIDAGWVIDKNSLLEIFKLTGIQEVQDKVEYKHATATVGDILKVKNDIEWKKSLAVVQSAKDLAKMLGI